MWPRLNSVHTRTSTHGRCVPISVQSNPTRRYWNSVGAGFCFSADLVESIARQSDIAAGDPDACSELVGGCAHARAPTAALFGSRFVMLLRFISDCSQHIELREYPTCYALVVPQTLVEAVMTVPSTLPAVLVSRSSVYSAPSSRTRACALSTQHNGPMPEKGNRTAHGSDSRGIPSFCAERIGPHWCSAMQRHVPRYM